jgi:hypothetical protein
MKLPVFQSLCDSERDPPERELKDMLLKNFKRKGGGYVEISPSVSRFRPLFSSVERGSCGSFASQSAKNLSYTASRARDFPRT